jgi:hypothetical protein
MLPMFRGIHKTRFSGAVRVASGQLPVVPSARGAQAGDFMLILSTNDSNGDGQPISASGGWQATSANDSLYGCTFLYFKVLTAQDCASSVSDVTNPTFYVIYRGATQLVTSHKAGTSTAGPATFSVAGFTPNARHAGMVAISSHSNNAHTPGTTAFTPSGFSNLGSSGFYYNKTLTTDHLVFHQWADRLYPANQKYAGENIGITYGDTAGVNHWVYGVELLT